MALLAFMAMTLPAVASRLEWDRIARWSGQGPNRAAIGIQFNDGVADCIYVFGFRWSGDTTCRDALRSLCASDSTLCLLEQRTSSTPERFCLGGIGFGIGCDVLRNLWFDFDSAREDLTIPFNYFATDAQGNLTGPGDDTVNLCRSAINAAQKSNHVVEHPINALSFGMPSYDYDYWVVRDIAPYRHWNAGWNTGNWVIWTGTDDVALMKYTGMAYDRLTLADGDFLVLNFNRHDNYPAWRDPVDGYSGASRPLRPLEYVGENSSSIPTIELPEDAPRYFSLDGRPVATLSAPGIYIERGRDGRCRTVYISNPSSTTP